MNRNTLGALVFTAAVAANCASPDRGSGISIGQEGCMPAGTCPEAYLMGLGYQAEGISTSFQYNGTFYYRANKPMQIVSVNYNEQVMTLNVTIYESTDGKILGLGVNPSTGYMYYLELQESGGQLVLIGVVEY